ncbi:hypothetical protein KFK09_020137 [Dendrobium nobile]|uniref:Uncharacterized protein n=1 Tax=Dendrobium nobile TaxID=94219 RepID=A0A8T3AT58_DENNO|nr:hypothetical protein KFK09_020137 [Dendrobium nobile]
MNIIRKCIIDLHLADIDIIGLIGSTHILIIRTLSSRLGFIRVCFLEKPTPSMVLLCGC